MNIYDQPQTLWRIQNVSTLRFQTLFFRVFPNEAKNFEMLGKVVTEEGRRVRWTILTS